MKMVRELGLERRETVRSLSTVIVKNYKALTLVREDRERNLYSVPVVMY